MFPQRKLALLLLSILTLVMIGTGCATTRTVSEQVDDGWITTKIEAKLTADPQVSSFRIDVDTLDGVVTLRGRVAERVAKSEAEKLAEDTRGVRRVINEIRVGLDDDEDQPITDAWIATKINAKFVADPQLSAFNIDVDVEGGRVTLSGKVESALAKSEAAKLARDTRGVVSVRNSLKVEKE